MKNILKRSIFVILPLLLILSIGGSFATWYYAGAHVEDARGEVDFRMNTFTYWEGAEILPNEDGESHVMLINNLLNGKDSFGADVGLNNPNSAISQNLENRLNGGLWGMFNKTDHYGSMDGSILDETIDMEGVFNTDTLGLSFIIQIIDDNTCYIFTTNVELGESRTPNIPIGDRIYPIYRSVAVRENTSSDYVVQSTAVGSAPSSYYEQLSGWGILHDQYVPSFDVDRWESFEDMPMGRSVDEAIWTFAGDSSAAFADDAETLVYYKLDDAGERTVTSDNPYAQIRVLDGGGNAVAQSSRLTVDGVLTVSVSFTLPEDSVYYLEFIGSNYIKFTVS